MKRYFLYMILIVLLGGCFKKDVPINAVDPIGLSLIADFESNQFVYLNLDGQLSIKNNTDNKWHLRFQNAPNKWYIYLNPLERTTIHKTQTSNWESVDLSINLANLEWQTDIPTSGGISPAIGIWGDFSFDNPRSYKTVYILRIRKETTASYYKLQVLDATRTSYTIRYGSLNGAIDETITIEKDYSYEHSFVEIDTVAKQKWIEPQQDDWALCLTYLADSVKKHGLTPHIPTINENYGVYSAFLMNQARGEVAIDSIHKFEDISFFNIQDLKFSRQDQLSNRLVSWNNASQKAEVRDQYTLIIRNGNTYHALRAQDIRGDYPYFFTFDLKVKRL